MASSSGFGKMKRFWARNDITSVWAGETTQTWERRKNTQRQNTEAVVAVVRGAPGDKGLCQASSSSSELGGSASDVGG